MSHCFRLIMHKITQIRCQGKKFSCVPWRKSLAFNPALQHRKRTRVGDQVTRRTRQSTDCTDDTDARTGDFVIRNPRLEVRAAARTSENTLRGLRGFVVCFRGRLLMAGFPRVENGQSHESKTIGPGSRARSIRPSLDIQERCDECRTLGRGSHCHRSRQDRESTGKGLSQQAESHHAPHALPQG
jgi:hypothetical protein